MTTRRGGPPRGASDLRSRLGGLRAGLASASDDAVADALQELSNHLIKSSGLLSRLARRASLTESPDFRAIDLAFSQAIELARRLNEEIARRPTEGFTSVSRVVADLGASIHAAMPEGPRLRVSVCAESALIAALRAELERAILALCEGAMVEVPASGEISIGVTTAPRALSDATARVARVVVESPRGASSLPPIAIEFARSLGAGLTLHASAGGYHAVLEVPCA